MKFRHILQFSFDRISRKIFWYLLSIVLGILVLVLIIFSSFIYFLSKSDELSVAEAINGSIDSYGTMNYNISDTSEDICPFVDAANDSDEILVLGDGYVNPWELMDGNELFDELVEIQNKSGKPKDYEVGEGALIAVFLDKYAFNLCAPKLNEGNTPEYYEINEETCLLYLGYNFSSVPVGSSFEYKGVTYIVAGIIKKGEQFLYPDAFYNVDLIDGMSTFTTDSYVFVVEMPDITSAGYDFIAADGYTIDEAENKLRELANEYGLFDITFTRIKDSIDWLTEQRSSVINISLWVFIITSITTVIIFMCFQLSSLWSDQNQFGVLLANGAGKSDLSKILFVENILRMFISLIVAAAFLIIYIKAMTLSGYSESADMFKSILYGRAIPAGVVAALCIAILSSAAPMYFVRKQEPVEMIRSFRG